MEAVLKECRGGTEGVHSSGTVEVHGGGNIPAVDIFEIVSSTSPRLKKTDVSAVHTQLHSNAYRWQYTCSNVVRKLFISILKPTQSLM